jgi:hypothetical protein
MELLHKWRLPMVLPGVYSSIPTAFNKIHLCIGRVGGMVDQREAWWIFTEAWWINGSIPDCCPAVPGSNPVSPQPTADCQSPDGLPPGMALGYI